VTLRKAAIGRYEDRLEFVFEDPEHHSQFTIVRRVVAIVGSKEVYNHIKPQVPYAPRPKIESAPPRGVVPGIRPPRLGAIAWKGRLKTYYVPETISLIMATGSTSDQIAKIRGTVLPSHLNNQTYSQHFKPLLWIEELRMA
jgi:helicase MOV-10